MTASHDRQALALKAATHAYLYANAVKFEAQALLLPASTEADLDPDTLNLVSAARQTRAIMLVLALRNVLRAAQMACRYADKPEKQNLRAAIARFKNAFPDVVAARGAIEHFDEYIDVDGQPAVLYEVTFTRGDGRYLITVGEALIDVQTAVVEARHLAGNAIATAGDAWTYPVGNEHRDQTSSSIAHEP